MFLLNCSFKGEFSGVVHQGKELFRHGKKNGKKKKRKVIKKYRKQGQNGTGSDKWGRKAKSREVLLP